MIDYYIGTPGPTIVIESLTDLVEALDILHTQVIDNIDDRSPYLRILEQAIDALEDLRGEV